MKQVALMITLLLLIFTGIQAQKRAALVYTKNGTGYIHDNIPASVEALKKLGVENHIRMDVSEDPSVFTDDNLKQYDVLIFDNTNNEVFDTDEQRAAFQRYIRAGGGFVGIHSACGTERDWPWFWAMLGGKFVRHPAYQKFTVLTIDPDHPSTRAYAPTWAWEDEAYYLAELNPDIHVLLAHDLSTIRDDEKDEFPGRVFGNYFPSAWCHEYDGGRQWYTAYGHNPEHYQDPLFLKHLLGGIRWAINH